ncbi:enoyl-CoA hydratase [Amycolatopsis sp.]|uniref:enoyl-CoA hydratase n=1 Tax=Amycolatopsis sp. TaxID=37632 RepID=UPI002C8C4189|nr:enoyl-CoA hydratase [Amycolatopsis sp.]HVV12676.1 enoyl-CoA hydratase [Amycolatopsis sp.]
MPLDADLLTIRENKILRVVLNRPDSLNALTTGLLEQIAEAIEAAGADPDIRVIVLSGAGRAFSAGADLAVGGRLDEGPDTATIDAANRVTRAIRQVPKPVLAAVNGPAVGVGCSFALAADLTVARESAYFLLAFANVGLMPDGGATALLPAAIGRALATRMAMLAERVPARTAADWGLISHVTPDADFESEVDGLAAKLAAGPTAAFARTKQAFNVTALAQLDEALATERKGQSELFETDDFAEGVAAFQQKRKPGFTGR